MEFYVSKYPKLSATRYKLHLITHLCPQLNAYITRTLPNAATKSRNQSVLEYSSGTHCRSTDGGGSILDVPT